MTAPQYNFPALRHLGFVQLQVTPGEVDINLTRLRERLAQLNPPRGSLIILPELWATGFAYKELPYLQDNVATLPARLQEVAERYDILLAGSRPERTAENQNFYFNTLEIIGRNGTFGTYRKRHIFPGEEQAFRPWTGANPPIETPAGVFGCLICYDLRFPGPARRQCQKGADLLLCSAQWPSPRIHHWRSLVIARAIENQTFVVACNGVGKNGSLILGGHSLIVTPAGEVLYEAGEAEEAKIIAIDWQMKRDAQAGFKSFTVDTYRLSAEKIVTPEMCRADAERRVGLGQRVIFCALKKDTTFHRAIEILEAARQCGDHLIVGVHPSGEVDGKNASAGKTILKSYASLGCVDTVLDLGEISPALEKTLKKICRIAGS